MQYIAVQLYRCMIATQCDKVKRNTTQLIAIQLKIKTFYKMIWMFLHSGKNLARVFKYF